MSNRPNLFLLGAPKCGTTSLANLMSQHSDIFLPVLKEPHFFSRLAAVPLTELQYLNLFKDTKPGIKWSADCSTCSLFEPHLSIPKILEMSPDAKFIVMLRSPIEMCYSLHNEELVHCNESVPNFEEAIELQESRSNGKNIPISCGNPLLLQYFERCQLGRQIESLFSVVPRDRVLVIMLDDLKCSSDSQLKKLADFLDISPFEDNLRNDNAAKAYRNRYFASILRIAGRLKRRMGFLKPIPGMRWIRSLNQHRKEKTYISEKTFLSLLPIFEPEIVKLEELLARDLSHWKRRSM